MRLSTRHRSARSTKPAVADVFFALGDETRLLLLFRIGAGPLSATALSIDAKVTRQAIMKHLQVLESAGLVTHEKHGREVLYSLEERQFEEARAFLETISAGWDRAIDRLRTMVESPTPQTAEKSRQTKALKRKARVVDR